ncbi:MAG: alpha/beta fold hydrolase [Bacteroidota bacterium]
MRPTTLSLEHLVREPLVQQKRPPVLFMLHGYGSNEEDLFSFAQEMPAELFIISIRAPYDLDPFGHAWYAINFDAEFGKWSDDGQAKESLKKITTFIDEACDVYHLDSDNITLLGFSQGTILGYALTLSYPEKIKNLVALSGYINPNIFVDAYQDNDFSNLAIYASHGTVDQVIPLEWAQKTPDFLNGLKISHVYEEFPVGHGVCPDNFYSFKAWLAAKI